VLLERENRKYMLLLLVGFFYIASLSFFASFLSIDENEDEYVHIYVYNCVKAFAHEDGRKGIDI
jgi:hypothetical protein